MARRDVDDTVDEVLKHKGEGTVFKASAYPPLPLIPTGVFMLDYALNGGYPEGLGFQVHGYRSGGKTTLCLMAVAEFQRKYPDRVAVWIDREMTFDSTWAEKLGVDLERLYVSQPAHGEEAIDIMIAFMRTAEVGLVVLDSVPTTTPKTITDESAEKDTMGALARLMGKMCSHMLTAWSDERKKGHRVTVGIINQWRDKVGFVMGDPRSLPGGRAIQHFVTTMVEMKNKEIKGKDEMDIEVPLYNEHSFGISKSKTELAVQEGKFDFVRNAAYPRPGMVAKVDDYDTVLAYAKKYELIGGGGNKWTVNVGTHQIEKFFKNKEDIIAHMIEVPYDYQLLKRSILINSRSKRKLTPLPVDGYLVGPEQKAANTERKRSR